MSYLEMVLQAVIPNDTIERISESSDDLEEIKASLIEQKETFELLVGIKKRLLGDDDKFDDFMKVIRAAIELDKEANDDQYETTE
jgi:hypothetical protein